MADAMRAQGEAQGNTARVVGMAQHFRAGVVIVVRHPDLRQVLADHWDLAIEDEGVTPVDALRSTFITACASSAAAGTAI